MQGKLYAVVNSITPSKNNEIFMVNTAKGGFMVRKDLLEKRDINVESIYKFPEPTVVVVNTHKKGDYLYQQNGGIAPQDSSRINPETGEPFYKKGDKPTWNEDGASVAAFVGFQEFKAQLEMEKLMKELA